MFSLPGAHMRTAGVIAVPLHPGADAIEDPRANVGIRVVPVLVQLEGHQDPDTLARGVVERNLVELVLEPAFDGVDAQSAHRGEVTRVQPRPLVVAEGRVPRVVADAANDCGWPSTRYVQVPSVADVICTGIRPVARGATTSVCASGCRLAASGGVASSSTSPIPVGFANGQRSDGGYGREHRNRRGRDEPAGRRARGAVRGSQAGAPGDARRAPPTHSSETAHA